MKQGTVKVNVKSLLNYTPVKDEEGKEVVENGQIKIVVGNDTIYNEKKPKTTTNISQGFSAKGNIEIKVYGMRNKNSTYVGYISNVYPAIFTVRINGVDKSFNYVDVLTGEVKIKYY